MHKGEVAKGNPPRITTEPENAIKYLDVSDTEFARLTYKGTKFHPVQPLLSPVRVQGMTKPVYLKETLDALKNNGLIRPKKSRGKYKTKN
jgi:hypothetical protein